MNGAPEGNLIYEKINIHNGLEVMESHYDYEQQGSHTKNVRTSAQVIRTIAGQDPFEVNTQYTYYTNGALKNQFDFFGSPKQVKTAFQYDDFGNVKRQERVLRACPSEWIMFITTILLAILPKPLAHCLKPPLPTIIPLW